MVCAGAVQLRSPHKAPEACSLQITSSCTQKGNPACKPLTFWLRSRHAWSQRRARHEVSRVRFCTGSRGQYLGVWGLAHHQTFPSHTHDDEAASWTEAHANRGQLFDMAEHGVESQAQGGGVLLSTESPSSGPLVPPGSRKKCGRRIWGDFCVAAPWIGSRALAIFMEGCSAVTQTYTEWILYLLTKLDLVYSKNWPFTWGRAEHFLLILNSSQCSFCQPFHRFKTQCRNCVAPQTKAEPFYLHKRLWCLMLCLTFRVCLRRLNKVWSKRITWSLYNTLADIPLEW